MPNVTAEEVKALMDIGNDPVDVTSHIAAASLVVEEDLVNSGLSTARKKQVELFLAAHFVTLAIEKGGLTRKDTGESSESYRPGSESDRGFMVTRYGQQAVSMDTSGILAENAFPRVKAQFSVITATSDPYGGSDA